MNKTPTTISSHAATTTTTFEDLVPTVTCDRGRECYYECGLPAARQGLVTYITCQGTHLA